ncbi:hypothetical protein VCSRO2_3540 [Vibrio cholerae]|nr:hypothetical protein VCSRO2_3540 [Vibrio cholerae]GHZ49747.1 hypothetical protein VCSRO8_3284 [Vibrio cholerae]
MVYQMHCENHRPHIHLQPNRPKGNNLDNRHIVELLKEKAQQGLPHVF